MRGTASIVDDEDRITRYEQTVEPWADPGGQRSTWVQIVADEISGR